ncbi:MAG: hypothetical protein MZV63_41660 [Marinilabiliales bacterium]|nr:hypothetical protein [Marinilabiliales bacterium]
MVLNTESSKVGSNKISLNNTNVTEILQQNIAFYDKNGEQHYDIISAFIKSIRGSDPNAAIYWLARMVEGRRRSKIYCSQACNSGLRRYWLWPTQMHY